MEQPASLIQSILGRKDRLRPSGGFFVIQRNEPDLCGSVWELYNEVMAEDQSFDQENDKDFPYFTHALAADAFDLTIRRARPEGDSDEHAKVELVFFQDKGNHKREVVAAVRMQLYELSALAQLIERKKSAFLKRKAGSGGE